MADQAHSLVPPRPFFRKDSTPPSSFPFQAYPGNPDPLRRRSIDSLDTESTLPRTGSLSDLHKHSADLYRASAAAPIVASPPATPSPAQIFRPAFLSPASRPLSSLSWAPPVLDYAANSSSTALHLSPSGSTLGLSHIHRPPLPSAMLEKAGPSTDSESSLHTPALDPSNQAKPHRLSWWLTFACLFLGVVGAAVICYTGIRNTKSKMFDESQLCLIMDEDFSSPDLNAAYWSPDVQVDDRGFQISSASSQNIYIQDNQLYIFPTLMRDENPDYTQDGQTYVVPGCTSTAPAPAEPAPGAGAGQDTNSTDTTGTSNTTTTTTSASAAAPQASQGQGQGGNGGGNHANGNANANGHGNNAAILLSARQHTNNSTTSTNSTTNSSLPAPNSPSGNACLAVTNTALGKVINPVISGTISTKGKVGIQYGRVEIVAKTARGDWLWPSIWMLPENNTYGAWPLSGEIDIISTRGNPPSYPSQGSNYIRSALQYGLSSTLVPISYPGSPSSYGTGLRKELFGWLELKRTSYDQGWHTYAVEWDPKWVRFWVDGRVRQSLEVSIDSSVETVDTLTGKGGGTFWRKGKFPPTAQNKTTGAVVVVQDPWVGGGPAAPFDQRFYLNINLGVGGTTGWFPDDEGGKPWYDGSATAMRDFNSALDTWYQTWPENPDDRAFRIKSVKMWSLGCQQQQQQ